MNAPLELRSSGAFIFHHLDPHFLAVIIQFLNFEPAMESNAEITRELHLLEHIEADPDVNQATLASTLGIAVGTVNWHLKRMVAKGYVKVKRAERKKLRYIITPEGLAFRARLTVDYIEQSFNLYRRTRSRAREQLKKLREQGYTRVRIEGAGDIADVCRLTCLELGFAVVDDPDAPAIFVDGMRLRLRIENQ
jgi:DNA-binding MarR family transcriptional regulator